MATDYAGLKAEIQNFLDNDNPNLVAAIPTFISDAEVWLGRNLHVRDMECVTPTPLVPAGVTEDTIGIYDLPSDWGGSKSITINGDNLILHYWRKIPALSDSNTTNWLLTDAPDVYLYGSLMQSAPYLAHDERLAVWAGLYTQATTSLQRSSENAKWGANLRLRP